jgi:hypothetical protein
MKIISEFKHSFICNEKLHSAVLMNNLESGLFTSRDPPLHLNIKVRQKRGPRSYSELQQVGYNAPDAVRSARPKGKN